MGLVFGFDDGRPDFNLLYYLTNLLKFIIISFIILLIYYRIQKFFAHRLGATIKITLWQAKNLKIPFKKKKIQFPLWIIIPLLISFLSRGQIYFATVLSTELIANPAQRLGRKHIHLTLFEKAKVLVPAPIILILIALLLNPISFLKDIATVSLMISVFSMLPFPGLAGSEIFFGSKPIYIFSLVFILIIALLLNLLSSTTTLAIAIICGLVALITYLYRFYKKR